MYLVFWLLGIQTILDKFVKSISKVGWWKANKAYIDDLGISVQVNIKDFPKKGGVLVYANHPTGLDPFLLSSVIERDDVYFISDIYHARKGREILQHMIPVYYSSWNDIFRRSGLSTLGYLLMRFVSGMSTNAFASQKNSEVIATAVDCIANGHVVLIFPSGGDKETMRWKKGIGEILVQCREKKITHTLFQCKIGILNEFGLLYHFIFGRRLYNQHSILISGELVKLSCIYSLITSVELTAYLQNFFNG